MLLDHVRVRAFRGIGEELSFNLTARLTIIHAPNGVGKTSLCDAVEWLLTGEVFRLSEALGKSDDGGIHNIFLQTVPPLAESEVRIDDENICIRRAGVSYKDQIEVLKGGKWKREPLDQMLGRLTPDTLPSSARGVQSLSNRKRWLRAVRFLESQALDLLLDSNKDGDSTRELAFCDLLGVGDLKRDERDLSKISKALGSKNQLSRDIRTTKAEMAALEAEIKAEIVRASGPLLEIFWQQIGSAAQRLRVRLPAGKEGREAQLAKVKDVLALSEERVVQKLEAFKAISGRASRYSALGVEISELMLKRQSLDAEHKRAQQEHSRATNTLQAFEADASKAEVQADSLASLRHEGVITALQRESGLWREQGGDVDAPIDVPSDEMALADARGEYAQARRRLLKLKQCEDSFPRWRDAKTREQAAQARISAIRLPSPRERAELDRARSEAGAELVQTEDNYNRLAGPVEKLRAAGHDFLAESARECRCPLCAHEYPNASALREAIAAGIATLPAVLNSLAGKKRALEKRIGELDQQQSLWNEAERQVQEARDQIEETRSSLEEGARAFAELRIDFEKLLAESLYSELRDVRVALEADSARLEQRISQLENRRDTALRLRDIDLQIQSLSGRAHAVFSNMPVIFSVYDQPPSSWLQVVERLRDVAKEGETQARTQASKSRAQAESARLAVVLWNTKASEAAIGLQEISGKIDEAESERRELDGLWAILMGKEPWSPLLFEQQPAQLQRDTEENLTARRELDSASAALAGAVEAETRERERSGRERRLLRLHGQLAEFENVAKVRSDCETGAKTLRDAKDAFVREQIRPLCDVITALYVRAQSAAFIDRIDSDVGEGPIRWLAHVGDRHLEDTAQMSLGQRQDLALAIFLARARELGGTFFLDEPLLHLDDLNRVALLDVLRTIVIESRPAPVRLVVTTANYSLVRHCREKFALLEGKNEQPALRVYKLSGDPQSGVEASEDN